MIGCKVDLVMLNWRLGIAESVYEEAAQYCKTFVGVAHLPMQRAYWTLSNKLGTWKSHYTHTHTPI